MNNKINYHFEFLDENNFRKKERSVKKYNMLAYKKLMFEYYPKIKEGNFIGKLVSENTQEKSKTFELTLPTDTLFAKVHGDMILNYTVYEDKNIVLLTNITPDEILSEGHRTELGTYKGVMISKANAEKDMFKVNLLNAINQK